jgi:glucokinase
VASSWKLPELVRRHPLYHQSFWHGAELIDFKALFEHYRSGEELAKDVVQHVLQAWTSGAINMIHAYDPEVLVLGGGVMKARDIILPYIREKIQTYAWTPWGKVEVKEAQLGDPAALYGLNYLLQLKMNKEETDENI